MTKPRLLLIDGHSMAYRAFFALPVENFATSAGVPTNAVYGFTSMLIRLIDQEQPTHIAVAWDVGSKTFRTERFPEYKGTRDETPQEFRGQVPLIQQVMDAMNIVNIEKVNYEADDIIATLATTADREGYEVLICSGDRDTLQLVTEDTTVLYPRRGVSDLSRMTPEAVKERYDVTPGQYSDLAALVGETSDNLPGVPKVGPKTAAKWINQFGGLAEILENAEDIGGKVGESLREHIDQVKLNRELNHLLQDLELPVGVADLGRKDINEAEVHQLFDALQFRTLRERLFALMGTQSQAEELEELEVATTERTDLGQWLAHTPVAIVADGNPGPVDPDLSALHLANAKGEHLYIDVTGLGEADEQVLAAWLSNAEAEKFGHGVKSLYHVTTARGWSLAGVSFDTQLAAYLCFPDQRGYDLTDLAQRFLSRDLSETSGSAGQDTLDFSVDNAEQMQHGSQQARAVFDLVEVFTKMLEERESVDLLTDIELPLSGVLADMERLGFAMDEPYLQELAADFAGQAQKFESAAHESIDRQVNLSSPKQLQEVLFDQLDMPKTKKIKSGYTTDAAAIADLSVKNPHPFLDNLLAYRDATKLKQTVEGLLREVAADGRVHSNLQQTVAATGRLSSTDPNLQNIPIRTAAGRRIRAAFVVGSGYDTLLTADYSQIEMRIMAHLSEDAGLIEAFVAGEDLHNFVGARVYGVGTDEVTGEMRSKIKAMSYGLAYGLSSFGLSKQLNIPVGEAQKLMDEYFERFGGVRDYLHEVVETARERGYTETIFGRRRYLPDLNSDNRQRRQMAERMALNAPIQGSAADLIKIAMLRVYNELRAKQLESRLILQIHDELVLEVATGEMEQVEDILRRNMSGAANLSVPLDVSVGRGENWQVAGH